MRILLVRHGETEANAAAIVQGHSQNPLSVVGQKQAEHLAERLKQESIDYLYASDLKRARDTAKIISQACGLSVFLTDRLRERSYGVLEGKPFTEYQEALAASAAKRHEFKPQGGENFSDVKSRAADFLTLLFSRYHGKTVLLVAHAGINKMLLSCLLNKSIEEAASIEQHNCCLNIVEINEEGNGCSILLNCTAHLQ